MSVVSFKRRSLPLFGAGVFILLLLAVVPVSAASSNISRSYGASSPIGPSNLVSLDANHQNYVEPANTTNGKRLIGVSVTAGNSLLAVDQGEGKVQVATSGTVTVLVSTLNGPIHVGDQVAVSPFNGVGALATPGSYVIGLARTDFTDRSPGALQQAVTDASGKSRQIDVGYVRLSIGVGLASTSSNLNSLQRFVKTLTGHTVATARIIVSIIITVIVLVVLVALIYGSIYSGIISIGRNPLAKNSVLKTLSLVFAMAAAMAGVAAVTIYLLLR